MALLTINKRADDSDPAVGRKQVDLSQVQVMAETTTARALTDSEMMDDNSSERLSSSCCCFVTAALHAKRGMRPSRWKDGLARSFVRAVGLISEAGSVKRDAFSNDSELKKKVKRLAGGNPEAIGSRCEAGLLRGAYERCRGVSTDQTHISVVTDEVLTFGLKSWSRARKVSCFCNLLRWSVGRHGLLRSRSHTKSAVERLAISCRAHCLLGRIGRLWRWRA